MINFGGVRIILWICTLVYLLQSIYYPVVDSLFGLSYIGNENFGIMQLVTHGFLHVDLYHILINMIMLVLFASKVEMFFGTKNLFKIFIGSVIFGGIFQTIYNMIVLNSLMGTMFPVEVISHHLIEWILCLIMELRHLTYLQEKLWGHLVVCLGV